MAKFYFQVLLMGALNKLHLDEGSASHKGLPYEKLNESQT